MSKVRVQESRKRYDGRCVICNEADYSILHAHRIKFGKDGGRYIFSNLVTVCPNCHAKIHSGRIVIHGRHSTSLGEPIIHYTEDGIEKWKKEGRRFSE